MRRAENDLPRLCKLFGRFDRISTEVLPEGGIEAAVDGVNALVFLRAKSANCPKGEFFFGQPRLVLARIMVCHLNSLSSWVDANQTAERTDRLKPSTPPPSD